MNVLNAFWLSVSIAVGIATATVLLLRRSLGSLLVEVCGSASRAKFWAIYSSISIVLATFLGMFASFPLSEGSDWREYPQIPAVLAAFRSSLLFLLFALGALGLSLKLGISDFEERRRREPPRVGPVSTLQV